MTDGTNYFYADVEEASRYDEVVGLTDPAYQLLHEELSRQIFSWLSQSPSLNVTVVDFGCGTGAEGLRLLRQHGEMKLIAIDNSQSMLKELQRKLTIEFGSGDAGGRCSLVEGDLNDEAFWSLLVAEYRDALKDCAAVVSACTLHHFSPAQKQVFYKRVATLLNPGGLFVNADLFSFEQPWLAKNAQFALEEWVNRSFEEHCRLHEPHSQSLLAPRDRWIRHIREENFPLPAMRSTLSPAESHSEDSLLLSSGFRCVECSFRYVQSAILMAFK